MQPKVEKKPHHPERPAGTDRNTAYREVRYDETVPAPDTLLSLLKYEYLRQELWVPLEKVGGRVSVLIDDPHNIQIGRAHV